MFIENHIENGNFSFDETRLKEISEEVLKEFLCPIPELTLAFVTPEEIRELNKNFRNVDAVTDVLSFGADEETDPETGISYLGDIVICLERAAEQAKFSGHPLENEIQLLEIHGLLHLLDFDHTTEQKKAEMWALQEKYLNQFGIQLGRKPGEDFDF